MIYKFHEENSEINLEVCQSNYVGTKVILKIEDVGFQQIALTKNQLYDLIGALHSLQNKINKIK